MVTAGISMACAANVLAQSPGTARLRFVVDARPSDATTDDPETLWREVLRRQPDNTRIFANYPPDPAVN